MKTLEPDMIIKFPDKLDYVGGKVTVEVSRPRKFLGFRWMSRFKKRSNVCFNIKAWLIIQCLTIHSLLNLRGEE